MADRAVIIVKVGTGVLTKDDGNLNLASITALSDRLAELQEAGHAVLLVSSGAVGAGVPLLGLDAYPEDIGTRQAAAAIGQARLMQTYQEAFTPHGVTIAQTLLSSFDLKEETHKERAKTVLLRLLDQPKVIPIVNENDVVSLRELTKTDNDMLAANLASIIGANTLILLTSVDGLLDADQQVIPSVDDIAAAAQAFVQETSGKFSIGGMKSKLDAVQVAASAGTRVIIGNGEKPERLLGYLEGKSIGTYFSVN